MAFLLFSLIRILNNFHGHRKSIALCGSAGLSYAVEKAKWRSGLLQLPVAIRSALFAAKWAQIPRQRSERAFLLRNTRLVVGTPIFFVAPSGGAEAAVGYFIASACRRWRRLDRVKDKSIRRRIQERFILVNVGTQMLISTWWRVTVWLLLTFSSTGERAGATLLEIMSIDQMATIPIAVAFNHNRRTSCRTSRKEASRNSWPSGK